MSRLAYLDLFTPQEIVQVLAGAQDGIDYPHLDRLLTQVRLPKLGVVEVMKLLDDMVDAEVIIYSGTLGRYVKGAKWMPVDTSRAKKSTPPSDLSKP